MRTYTLNEIQDELLGKIGTPERDKFEYELQMDINTGKSIRDNILLTVSSYG